MHDQRMEDGMGYIGLPGEKLEKAREAKPVKDIDILNRFDELLEVLDYNLMLSTHPRYKQQLQLCVEGVEGALARFKSFVYERE